MVLFQFDSKKFASFQKGDTIFLFLLYSLWPYNFLSGSLRWIDFFYNLFFTAVNFWRPGVIQGLVLNSILYLFFFFGRSMCIKERNDIAQLGFNRETDTLLFSFQQCLLIKREVVKNTIFLIKIWRVSFKNFRLIWLRIFKCILGYKKLRKMIRYSSCYITWYYFMWCKITKNITNTGLGVTSKSSRLEYIREQRAGCMWVKKIVCRPMAIII